MARVKRVFGHGFAKIKGIGTITTEEFKDVPDSFAEKVKNDPRWEVEGLATKAKEKAPVVEEVKEENLEMVDPVSSPVEEPKTFGSALGGFGKKSKKKDD